MANLYQWGYLDSMRMSITRTFTFLLLLLAASPASPATAEELRCDLANLPPLEALYQSARALDDGLCGQAQDKSEAFARYRKAAEQGYMPAQYQTAESYFGGDGVQTDYAKAKEWYLKAAKQGHGLSQLRLGFLSAEKHFTGVTADLAQAETWFKKAAEQDAGDARFRLGNFYINYKRPPDYAQGSLWLQKAAEGGHRTAMYDLGRLLVAGEHVEKDEAKGMAWITKAAEANLLQAQMTLADIYTDRKEPLRALKWILRLTATPKAPVFYLNRAADMFFEGKDGVPRNYPAARQYYERAAQKGDRHAASRLADIYAQGLGVEKDETKAAEYLKKATSPSGEAAPAGR